VLTPEARAAIARLDDAGTLKALMRALVESRVKPYYLHHLDKAPGTSHFRCTLERGREIVRELRERASGICQPTYVLDIPGGHGKTPIAESGLRETDTGYEVRDRHGEWRPA